MKNKIALKLTAILALIVFWGCDPFMEENPDAGLVLPPDASALNFTVSPGKDAFHFKVDFTSPELPAISVVQFDLGNGDMVKSKSATAYYPMPGEYTIKMTVTTNGGSTSISKVHKTTQTDYTIFQDEKYIALSGGVEALQGKTWVIDAATPGHFGVGPSDAGSSGLEWWSASPFTKEGTGAYDDEITFKIEGFNVSLKNYGVSYVKGYMKDDAKYKNIYRNPRLNKDDWDVDYTTPVSGTWSIKEKEDGNYLVLNGQNPIFFGLDVGALNNEYKIVNIGKNVLELTCFSAYENWTKWHFLLIPKGYERPKIEYNVAVDKGSATNDINVKFTVTNIPAGESISKMIVDFGDGNVSESTDVNKVVTNTYMRKGTYTIKVTSVTSLGTKTDQYAVSIDNNHPDYEEFLLNEIVMYADFSEVTLAPVEGQDCFVGVTANPAKMYPNKSSSVAFYSKANNQWANAYMALPAGYRFDLRQKHTFKMKVFGKAGDKVLMKLENTDKGGNAWQTGTYDLIYTIKKDNTWETAEYDFAGTGAGWDWTGDIFTGDVTTDSRFNNGFYNVVRIMLNPGVGEGTHEFYFDELAGPHVEGIKSARIK